MRCSSIKMILWIFIEGICEEEGTLSRTRKIGEMNLGKEKRTVEISLYIMRNEVLHNVTFTVPFGEVKKDGG